MADACGRIVSGGRDRSETEATTSTSPRQKEDDESSRIAHEREAERKRDDFFARQDPSVTGQSAQRNTCSPLRTPAMTADWDAQKKASVLTAKMDRPLQEDVLGNALIGALAGGLGAGMKSLILTSSMEVAVSEGFTEAGKEFVQDSALETAKEVIRRSAPPEDMTPGWASPIPPSSAGVEKTESAGGKCGSDAACETGSAPNESRAPAHPDRAPYAPGKAPPAEVTIPGPYSVKG